MPPPTPWLQLDDEQLLRQCRLTLTRRGGPGGQHRNKVSTAVVLEHQPTAIRVEANERRSQAANRQVALARLRRELAVACRHPIGPLEAYQPSATWRRRLAGGRLVIGAAHRDLPELLAEALDVLEAADWQVAPAAEHLGCTPSQLVRLLRMEPLALRQLNDQRVSRGLRPLV